MRALVYPAAWKLSSWVSRSGGFAVPMAIIRGRVTGAKQATVLLYSIAIGNEQKFSWVVQFGK